MKGNEKRPAVGDERHPHNPYVEAVERLLYGDEEHRPRDVRHVLALPPDGRRDHGDHEDLAQVDRVEHLVEGERRKIEKKKKANNTKPPGKEQRSDELQVLQIALVK